MAPARISALLVACCLLSACSDEQEAPAAPPLAHIQAASGAVSINPQGGAKAQTAGANAALFLEDIVHTGPDGHATVDFGGGNLVELGPNSSLVVRRVGAALAEIGAVLLSGKLTAKSAGTTRLAIGMPFGLLQLGTKLTVLDVDVQQGVIVKVGEVEFIKDGKPRTVLAGRQITVAGLDVAVGGHLQGLSGGITKTPPATLVLKPINFVLFSKPKAAQVLMAGQKVWKPAQKRTVLHSGDKVRVKKGAAGTRVQFDDNATLTVKSDSEVDFLSPDQLVPTDSAGYQLQHGGMQIALRREDGKDNTHEVQVAGMTVRIKPTVRDANVDISSTKTGAELAVRAGVVMLPDNTLIEAGMVVDIANGKVAGPTRLLSAGKVDVHSKTSTILYYDKRPPPVNFVWSDTAGKEVQVEVATDRDFKQIVVAEKISRGSLIIDSLTSGKYFWRLDQDVASRSVLQLMQESEGDCASCKRSNFIDDTGEKTVVYFQQTLPAIVLRWKEVDGAKQYSVKVFADGAFDKPLADEKTSQLSQAFDAGRFGEGKYYWLVSAQDDQGSDLATGRMNSLQIAYDNAITALVIKSPRQGQMVPAGKFVTSGEAELGTRAFVNGKRIEVDDKGRFSEGVVLHPGMNQLVYRALGTDGIERIYLRDVTMKR